MQASTYRTLADAPGDGGRRNAKRRPAWQILLAALGAILVCFAAAFAIGCWRQASALNAQIAAIRARGEPVRFSELAPPPGDESLVRGDRLSAALETLKPIENEDLLALISSEMLPRLVDFSPFQSVLDENRMQIDEITRICRTGDCRLRYDFAATIPFGILLPSVQKTDDLRRLFVADVLRLSAAGAADEAAAKVCDLLLIASVLQHEVAIRLADSLSTHSASKCRSSRFAKPKPRSSIQSSKQPGAGTLWPISAVYELINRSRRTTVASWTANAIVNPKYTRN